MPHRPQAPATSRALVWFKRDLRQDDHAPLAAAQHFESALGLFIIEPEWLASPEFSTAHLQFVLDSLAPLRASLAARGLPLLVRVGAAVEVLAAEVDALRDGRGQDRLDTTAATEANPIAREAVDAARRKP